MRSQTRKFSNGGQLHIENSRCQVVSKPLAPPIEEKKLSLYFPRDLFVTNIISYNLVAFGRVCWLRLRTVNLPTWKIYKLKENEQETNKKIVVYKMRHCKILWSHLHYEHNYYL